VQVRGFDFSRVAQELLRGAEQEASLVFHPARIALVWVAGPLSAAEAHELKYRSTANDPAGNALVCDGQPDECRLDIRLLSSDGLHFRPGPLGEAFPCARAGIRATIFSDRVQLMINRRPSAAPVILGHVLAHEIGHVLLGTTEHASGGLMRSSWQDSDLERMPRMPLSFERVAIRTMNDRLKTRRSTNANAQPLLNAHASSARAGAGTVVSSRAAGK
jgi:hypothetical protein